MIHYSKESNSFFITTKTLLYAMKISPKKRLVTLYFGTKIANDDVPDINSVISRCSLGRIQGEGDYAEYMGGLTYGGNCEPTMEITFPDASRDSDLYYMTHKINENTLTVTIAGNDCVNENLSLVKNGINKFFPSHIQVNVVTE